jgi:hypothetical protein
MRGAGLTGEAEGIAPATNQFCAVEMELLTDCLFKDCHVCSFCMKPSSHIRLLDRCTFHTGILSFWYLLPGKLQNEEFTRYPYLD